MGTGVHSRRLKRPYVHRSHRHRGYEWVELNLYSRIRLHGVGSDNQNTSWLPCASSQTAKVTLKSRPHGRTGCSNQPHHLKSLTVHLRTLTEANGSELWLADTEALFVKLKCGTPSGSTARLEEQWHFRKEIWAQHKVTVREQLAKRYGSTELRQVGFRQRITGCSAYLRHHTALLCVTLLGP